MASTTSSPSADYLLRIRGIVAARQFTAEGEVVNYKTNSMPMPEEMRLRWNPRHI